ncbi:MAG: mechanosensitive ion channel family protein [Chitinophagales bacterium]|nr:mechanosensitive ion channel family protein [Chitinophagales bacterium]
MRKYSALLILCIYLPFAAFAQKDSVSVAADSTALADSLKNEVLVANTKLLQKLDSTKTADSLRKAALEAELSSLKTTDNLKKQELLAELQQIKTAEQERIAAQKARIDSLKHFVEGFPVSPFMLDTLFYVYAKLGPFTPRVRAHNIDVRIKEIESDMFYHSDSIKIFTSEQTIDLVYRDGIILSITDVDALWMGMDKEKLAALYKQKIADSIKEYRKATSLQTLLKEIGLAVVVIIIVVILIRYLNKGHKWLVGKIVGAKGTFIKGIKIREYELFTADSEVRALHLTANVIRWVIIFLLIYLALPVLFSIFPWTKTLSGTLFGYILSPVKKMLLAMWNYLPNLITIIVIIFIFRYVFRGLKYLKHEVERGALKLPGFYADWATPTYQIIRILVFAFMVVVIFPYLPGSDSPIFQGVSVFLGVLFTFGSSGSLSNIVAGLVLTYMRAYRLGDRVQIGDVTGDIIEKTLLVTRIRTIKNEEITIPNATVMNSHTINYSTAAEDIGLIVHTTVTIGYDVPWKHVHELLINAANESDHILKDPAPFVLQTSLDDFYVSYQVNAYTKDPSKQAVIYSSIHQHIQDKFNEAGVEIMSPHYSTLRDGNQTTIPADYLPPDYITPSFNVKSNGNNDKS